MHRTKRYLSILIILAAFICACGDSDYDVDIVLSGKVTLDEITGNINGPIIVAIADSSNMDEIANDISNSLLDITTANSSDHSFSFDLSEMGLKPGDRVSLFTFVDNDYTAGVPYPSVGDYVGFFADLSSMSLAYSLKAGNNEIEINLNREYFSFETTFKGSINNPGLSETGNMIIFAYPAEKITSSDFSDFSTDYVLGYAEIKNIAATEWPVSYNLDIYSFIPYGLCKFVDGKLTVDNVCILAALDINQNNEIDSGDRIGYFNPENDGYPGLLTAKNDSNSTNTPADSNLIGNVDIDLSIEVGESSGTYILLKGNYALPQSIADSNAPVYIFVTDPSFINKTGEDQLSTIKYFKRVEKGEDTFRLNLTGLNVDDDIMVFGLLDRNTTSIFPKPTEGDFVGMYIDKESMDYTFNLDAGVNEGVSVEITREIFSFNAQIQGTIKSSDTGTISIIAYAGELTSLEPADINYDAVVGITQITKENNADLPFTLDIMPYGYNVPIQNVCIYGFLDADRNAQIDQGDKIGFYNLEKAENPGQASGDICSGNNGFPTILTLDEGTIGDKDLYFSIDLTPALGQTPYADVSISGSFNPPAGYDSDSDPVFIMVLEASKDISSIFDNIFSSLRYFKKLPPGQNQFDIDLTDYGLTPGDSVIVSAFWDKDYNKSYPNINEDDLLGYYHNTSKSTMSTTLNEGVNLIEHSEDDYDIFKINQLMSCKDTTIEFRLTNGNLTGDEFPWINLCNTGYCFEAGDEILIIAIHEDGISLDVTGATSFQTVMDMDYIISYTSIIAEEPDPNDPYDENYDYYYYSVGLLPMINEDISVSTGTDIYMFAIQDSNRNGLPDSDEVVGYYYAEYTNLLHIPAVLTITDGVNRIEDKAVRFTNARFQ